MLLLISYTPVLRNKDKNFIAPNLYISTDILSSSAELALTASNVSRQCKGCRTGESLRRQGAAQRGGPTQLWTQPNRRRDTDQRGNQGGVMTMG